MSAADSTKREKMLQSQIVTGNVLEPRLLSALNQVERERFVPPHLRASAYVDDELPVAAGRFLMEPLVFARLLKYAAIDPSDTVLDIGCATGYSAAVLSKLARHVVVVEEDESLSLKAKALLMGSSNIEIVTAPLAEGMRARAPYDIIIIEGAVEFLPQSLSDQLREAGRLLTVEHEAGAKVGSATGLGKIVEYTKVRGGLYKRICCDANVALLAAFKKPAVFSL